MLVYLKKFTVLFSCLYVCWSLCLGILYVHLLYFFNFCSWIGHVRQSSQFWQFLQVSHVNVDSEHWFMLLYSNCKRNTFTLLLGHWYEIMALYYVKLILTEISASRQDRRVLQKSKIIRIKFLSKWGMLQTSRYV